MSKRVVHFSCVAPPDIGGIGSVAAEEVLRLQNLGFDAHLISLTTHPSTRFGNAGNIYGIEHFVREADIVHLHYPFFGTAKKLATLRTSGKISRLVVTFHMDATAKGVKGRIFDLYRSRIQPEILSAADAILVSSLDYARESSAKDFESKFIELPFGIDEHEFYPIEEKENEASAGIKRIPNQILFVGGMDTAHAFKGVDHLLHALVELPEARCVLVGDGDLRASYESLARKLGLERRVQFKGRLDRKDIVREFQSATVFAFPSTSSAEAFGLVAVEAQACGTPVVASNLPGVRTVVRNGETGFLIPVGDRHALAASLKKLLDDPALLSRFSSAARKNVLANFTWARHMDGLVRVYEQLCESHS